MCPWSGNNCDCVEFPYRIDGFIPEKCERLMMLMTPYTAQVRSVSASAKAEIKRIIAEDIERMRNPNKSAADTARK